MPGSQHPEVSQGLLPPVAGQGAPQRTRAELGPESLPWEGESPGTCLLRPRSEAPEKLRLPFCGRFSVNTMSSQRSACSPVVGGLFLEAGGFLRRMTFGQLVEGNSETDVALDPPVFHSSYCGTSEEELLSVPLL